MASRLGFFSGGGVCLLLGALCLLNSITSYFGSLKSGIFFIRKSRDEGNLLSAIKDELVEVPNSQFLFFNFGLFLVWTGVGLFIDALIFRNFYPFLILILFTGIGVNLILYGFFEIQRKKTDSPIRQLFGIEYKLAGYTDYIFGSIGIVAGIFFFILLMIKTP